jgi:hypothetical protein
MIDARFYGYKFWTLEVPARCFYVGRGRKGRARLTHHNHKCGGIAKRYGIHIEVCIGPITHEEACAWEIEEITKENTFTTNHSHDDLANIGCNFTKGGEGVVGYCEPKSPEHNEKNRLSKLGTRNPMFGKLSPMCGKRHTNDANEKNRQSHKGLKATPKTRQKNSIVAMRKWANFEQRKHQSDRLKLQWQDLEKRKIMSEKLKGRSKTCSQCQKLGHNRLTCKEGVS